MEDPKKEPKGLLKIKEIRKTRDILVKYARKIIIPGFGGMPLYDVFLFFIRGTKESSITSRANSLSFTFMLAIFPAIIFFFTLIPYFPVENLDKTILQTIADLMPENAYKTVESTITDLVNMHRGGLLSLGFLLTIYFSTNGVMGIMKAFNRSSHTVETRSKFKLFLISLLLVFIIAVIIIITTSLLILSSWLARYLEEQGLWQNWFTLVLIDAGKWILIMAMVFFVISFIYYLAPAKKREFSFFSPGSILATILSLLFIMGFNYYIDHFAQYNKLYGSLGTLIILMIWVNLNAIALLIGYELNASIYDAKNIDYEPQPETGL
ncbi:MAG: YihY/virulence factor BrkB family protein [Bacteroidales bacterium]